MDREALEKIGRVENRHDGEASVGSLSYLPCNLDATESPKDLEAMAEVYSLLAQYARSKENAMILRRMGNIAEAQNRERFAQRAYDRLPSWARW